MVWFSCNKIHQCRIYIYIYIFKKNLGHYYVAIVEMDPFYICQKAVCGCLCILEE